jgi:hypothetical protein
MPRIRFEQLVPIYRALEFDADGAGGTLTVPTEDVRATLAWIDNDPDAQEDSGLSVQGDPAKLAVGDTTRLTIQPPQIGLGRLARDFAALLQMSGVRLAEPENYYLFESNYVRGGASPPNELAAYRKVLKLVERLKQAAAAFDPAREKLIFLHGGNRLSLAIDYTATDIARVDENALDGLEALFADPVHGDQKLEILGEAVARLAQSVAGARQFTYLLANLESLQEMVRNGYQLFVSSFSYAKVRGELETAKLEFIAKIHKSLVDIQGQLLGIPIATFVVASQMKRASSCSVETIADVAIVAGAWIFFGLLVAAIVNQWLTLDAISAEVARQESKIQNDFASAANLFTSVFEQIKTRASAYRIGFVAIGIVAAAGALFASISFNRLVDGDWWACVTGAVPVAVPTKT